MTRIILVRHGQTEWNRVERFRGRADLDLNDIGHAQAEATAQALRRWAVDRIFSSPLRRTWQTAEPAARLSGSPLERLDGLVDIDYGAWQGLTPEEAAERDPRLYRTWVDDPSQGAAPGGESLAVVRERSTRAMERVVADSPEQTLLLVSHKVVCKLLVLHVLGLSNARFWDVEQDNAAIDVFVRHSRGYRVELVNDTCHLQALG